MKIMRSEIDDRCLSLPPSNTIQTMVVQLSIRMTRLRTRSHGTGVLTLMYFNPAIFSNHDLPHPHILSFFFFPPGLFCSLYVGCTRRTPPLIQNSTDLKT